MMKIPRLRRHKMSIKSAKDLIPLGEAINEGLIEGIQDITERKGADMNDFLKTLCDKFTSELPHEFKEREKQGKERRHKK